MTKRRVLSLVLAGVPAVMLFTGGAAGADLNYLLRGDYAFSGESACLTSAAGFDSDLTPADSPAPFPSVTSSSVHGVRTFNGDGTGKVVGRNVSFSHPFALPNPAPPHFFSRGGASSSDFEADFTYHVTPDRTFAVVQPMATGTFLTGTRAGQTFTFGPVPLVGRISHDNKILLTAGDTPVIETQNFSNGDIRYRICHRSRTLFHLRKGN